MAEDILLARLRQTPAEWPKMALYCGVLVVEMIGNLLSEKGRSISRERLIEFFKSETPLFSSEFPFLPRAFNAGGRGMMPSTVPLVLEWYRNNHLPFTFCREEGGVRSVEVLIAELRRGSMVLCLVHLDKADGTGGGPHWVLLLGADPKRAMFYLYDPSAKVPAHRGIPIGNKVQSFSEFLSRWDKVLVWKRLAFLIRHAW